MIGEYLSIKGRKRERMMNQYSDSLFKRGLVDLYALDKISITRQENPFLIIVQILETEVTCQNIIHPKPLCDLSSEVYEPRVGLQAHPHL